MRAHTPLPWSLDVGHLCIRAADGNVGLMNLARSQDESMANAALIVAAVNSRADLISVLHEVEAYLEDREDVVDGPYGEPQPNTEMALLREVRIALAKAGAK